MKAVSAFLVAACAVVAHVTATPHSGFAVRDHSRNNSSPLYVELSSGFKGIVIATVANNGSSDLNFLMLGNFLMTRILFARFRLYLLPAKPLNSKEHATISAIETLQPAPLYATLPVSLSIRSQCS